MKFHADLKIDITANILNIQLFNLDANNLALTGI